MEQFVFFDLDDVLFKTNPFIIQNMTSYIKNNKKPDRTDKVIKLVLDDPNANFLTVTDELEREYPELAKELSNRVWKFGLLNGNFINKLEPNLLLKQYIQDILVPQGLIPGICTHRKSVDEFGNQTKEALRDCFPDIEFRHLYLLDKSQHPNKIAFLDTLHREYVLVDDNPIHTPVVLAAEPKLVVWNEAHDFPRYINQRKAKNIIKLHQHINECLLTKR